MINRNYDLDDWKHTISILIAVTLVAMVSNTIAIPAATLVPTSLMLASFA